MFWNILRIISYYIGTGQAICLLENERVGCEKLIEAVRAAHDAKSMKKLEKIGDYPGSRLVFDEAFLKKCTKIRSLQGKYGLAMNLGLGSCLAFMRSPIFHLSDLFALKNGSKANQKVLEFLQDFDLNAQSKHYEVPVYYILGAKDWQAPYPLAQSYLNGITAPRKKLFLLPEAGHMMMLDQPDAFAETFLEIAELEGQSGSEAPSDRVQAG